MLATFGLERLESGITDKSADDAATLAKFIAASAPAPEIRQRALARRAAPVFPTVPPLRTTYRPLDDEPGLPTRRYGRAEANPSFQATPQANRV
ncbi:MAG: hypothetical protein ABWY93_13050 [Mycobacterium sp.]